MCRSSLRYKHLCKKVYPHLLKESTVHNMSRFSYVVICLAVLVPLYSPAQDQSPLRGVVTDPGSPSAFTVDGLTVLCTSATESVSVNATAITDDGVVSKTGDS